MGREAEAATPPLSPEMEAERAREIALRLLTHAPRTATQLREALVAREVREEVADRIVDRYREVGLLDDAALAATIVRTRHAERGQAGRAIRQELVRKGFEEEDIAAALEQIDPEDERERARELAAARWARLSGVPEQVRIRRVVAMLGRKGYPPALAFAVVKDLGGAEEDLGD